MAFDSPAKLILVGLCAISILGGCTAVATAPKPVPTVSVAPGACNPVTGNICTLAGTGQAQFDGDGKAPLQTSFYLPIDLGFDAAGLLYIDDWNNFKIRRVTADGKVQTIMGFDFEGPPVQGAQAKDTPLHHPYTIAFDGQNNFYLAGYHVADVLKVSPAGPDGIVTVMAGTGLDGFSGNGGPATAAQLASPTGVTPLPDGSLVIVDSANNCLRKVGPDGTITQLAGTTELGFSGDGGPATAAQLNQPLRANAGPGGELYIADTNNNRIRKLALDGTITTVAGTGTPGFAGDGGPASAAQLNQPRMATVGPDGLLYIADAFNDRIRRIKADGTIETVAGSGTRGFAGDGGPALQAQLKIPSSVRFDARGNMYIADTLNYRVREVFGASPSLPPGLSGGTATSPSASPSIVAEVARAVVRDNTASTRLTVNGDVTSGAGSFDINIPPASFAAALARAGSATVSAKVTTISATTAAEQAAIGTATVNGASLLGLIQLDIADGLKTSSLRQGGFHTQQAATATALQLKSQAASRCSTGGVSLFQITDQATARPATLFIDDGQPLQTISGSGNEIDYQAAHFLFAFVCPRQ